jgi:recA bacterial DNA recombination protein
MQRRGNFTWRLPERRRAVAIYGPTSSGKTALSLDVVASQTHGYREFVRVAASTGKPITELGAAVTGMTRYALPQAA